MKLNEIYKVQSFLDPKIVEEKRQNQDYTITVKFYKDDNKEIPIIVDGHHSLQAAIIDKVEPNIIIDICNYPYTLEQFVTSFNDLDNPVNIITGKYLW